MSGTDRAIRAAGKALAAAAIIACGTACTKDLELPPIGAKKQIVLLGELTAGEPLYLRAGQSVPVTAGSSLSMALVQGLQLSVKDGTGTVIPLQGGSADSLSGRYYTVPFFAAHTVQPGGTYDLTATHTELGTATAQVSIPLPFTASVADTAGTTYAGREALKVDIRIQDAPGGPQYYVIEALKQQLEVGSFLFKGDWYPISRYRYRYDSLKLAMAPPPLRMDTTYIPAYTRLESYTTDPRSENLGFSNVQTPARRILFRDRSFDGQVLTTTVYISRQAFIGQDAASKGRVLIQVKSVSEDYFKYLRLYEQAAGTFDPQQPLQLTGNIVNGYGMAGGVSRQQFAYVFDRWEF